MIKIETLRKKLNMDFEENAFEENMDKIKQSNLQFYKLFNYIMIILLMVLYVSTFFSNYANSLKEIYWFFILLSITELLILRINKTISEKFSMSIVVFGIVKAYLFCLFTSVIFNANGPAITYYIFLILLPVSFLLRPKIMYGIQTIAVFVFCIATIQCKPMSIASGDVLSCLLFYVISLVIAGQIEKLRISNISMAAKEHKRNIEIAGQRDLLGIALKIAKLSAWNYDLLTKTLIPTYTPAEFTEFNCVVKNIPELVIENGLVHPSCIELIRELYEKADKGEDLIQGDILLRSFNSKFFRWFHLTMTPVREPDGTIKQYVGTSEDITEQKNIEFQYSEQLRILDSSNEKNLITKGQWNLTTNQQEMRKSNGNRELPSDKKETYDIAMSTLIEAIFPKEKKSEMKKALNRQNLINSYRKGIDAYTFEYQRMTKKSSSIWVKMLVRICQVPGKEDIMAFGFSYDITEEVLNQNIINRLVAVEYDFLGTVNIETGNSIVHSAQNANIAVLNKLNVYQRVTNYHSSLIKGIDQMVLFDERELLKKSCNLKTIIQKLEQEPFIQLSFSVIEEGSIRRKNLGYCYLNDSKNTILYFCTDITKMYEREQEQLNQTKQALEIAQHASAAKTDFFSRMSHDMRTPMNGILGLANLSQEENDPIILKTNIAKIRESGEYLLSLINDTLDFQKIESGRLILEPQIVSTRELVNNVLSLIQNSASSKNINLKMINKHADLDCFVYVDPIRMKQIFLNLLSNAVKFTQPGGTVEICFECIGHTKNIAHDLITVKDTGIGMSKKFMKNDLFKPFSQEHNEVIANYAGSGLGLSIVKKLVELMNGEIIVESKLGVGTTFTVKIDFERSDSKERIKVVNNVQVRREKIKEMLTGTRILLAEDHPLNAEIAIKLLEKVNCTIQWVKNGEECVEKFSESLLNQYDLILMDIRMPKLDGMEAAKQIRDLNRKDAKTIPIIAMTANAYEEDVKKALLSGMTAHLAKPIEPMLMYETILKVLESETKI